MSCSCKMLENMASGAIKFASENWKIASDNQIAPGLCRPLYFDFLSGKDNKIYHHSYKERIIMALCIMPSQALMRARNFGLGSLCLKSAGKLFRIFLGGDCWDQGSLRAAGFVTSCMRFISKIVRFGCEMLQDDENIVLYLIIFIHGNLSICIDFHRAV